MDAEEGKGSRMADTGVPHTLALAWGLAAAPQRGPKRELSLERIVDAAIEIADAEGLSAVTMQRVAKTFEFSTMALYRYVATKDDLHQLMLDTAMSAQLAPLNVTDWQSGFRELLRGLVAAYRRHPWALDIRLTPDIHLMPGQIRVADIGLHSMRGLAVPAQIKLGILMLLSAFARGQAAVEREVLAGIDVGPETRALIEEAVSLSAFPDVAALVKNGEYFGDEPAGSTSVPLDPEAEADAILEFAVQVLIAGLESTLEDIPLSHTSAPTPPPSTPQEAYEASEARLRQHKELRKQAQQRLREMEREEATLQKARDRAKELAKAHAKLAQG
jgi:AcrR family transcriptional regulator